MGKREEKKFQTVICGSCGHVAYTVLDNGWFTCIWCDEVQRKEGEGK